MEYRRPTPSSASFPIHDHNRYHSRRSSSSRSAGRPFPSLPAPMAVPNIRHDDPPPPLPPPRFVDAIAAGSDPGWAWGNDPRGGQFGKSKSSSAEASKFPKSWTLNMEEKAFPERPESKRRESSDLTLRSLTDSERRYNHSRQQDEGYYSLSGPNILNSQLQGEKQLHHRDQEKSSHSYDNKLLSKLGKPSSPPRSSTFGSVESSPTSSIFSTHSAKHAPQLRSLSLSTSSHADVPIKQEPCSRFGDSPQSRPLSPGQASLAGSAKNFMEYRSPTMGHLTRSSTIDSESYPPYAPPFSPAHNGMRRQKSRRSDSGCLLSNPDSNSNYAGFVDESALSKNTKNTSSSPAKVKRENYDLAGFPESDSTSRMEEKVRHLHLEDRSNPPYYPDSANLRCPPSSAHPLHSSHSRLGMKRKQLSPPSEVSQEEARLHAQLQHAANSAQQYQTNAPQFLQAQSAAHFAPHQGSISSQSSGGYRDNSYASSGGPSVGGSSYTSIDQQSSGGVSPSSEQQHFQHLNTQDFNSSPMNPAARNTRAGPYPQPPQPNDTRSTPARKTNENPSQRRSTAPNIQSNMWICGCCPKKPKKFDTQAQLSAHTNEKQYGCLHCSNRFKNKNEAERHQNSIHRRTHSWSCSVLASNHGAAFFPSSKLPSTNGSPGQQPQQASDAVDKCDICGYCGEEFPNEPQDWDARTQHLNNCHKFGECNQSKKFYRADHFRQHLKHSHGGKSGKWTNLLEGECSKPEQLAVSIDDTNENSSNSQAPSAPVANMGNMGPPDMGPMDMGQQMGQQGNLGQVNHMVHDSLDHNIAQMDMSNIDPNIGMQAMSNMVPGGDLSAMGPPRQIQMQGAVVYNNMKEEM